MIPFLADECLNENIVRGLLRSANMNFVRARDVGLEGKEDADLLAWAAMHHRVVLTHDCQTMPAHAFHRIIQGQSMPGVLIIPANLGVGSTIDEVLLVHQLGVPEDFDHQVRYLPLR